jgi:hypothetical protein
MPTDSTQPTRFKLACVLLAVFLVLFLSACSPRLLIVQGLANELATQGQAEENDLVLARDASAFYLKLSESLLRETPGNIKLAQAVASGFTQYAYAFVAFEAEKIESRDAKAAQRLRERAARLYWRAHRHAMAALEHNQKGFAIDLASNVPAQWPRLRKDQVALAYWAAASWGAFISLSKDDPETVADFPLALRLARLAWAQEPNWGDGALATLMGSFEAARPGGQISQAKLYFDRAIELGAGRKAGAYLAKAEAIALPAGERADFEALLQLALQASKSRSDIENEVMRERALWLLENINDLF